MPGDSMTDRIVQNTAPRPGEGQVDHRQRVALLQAEAIERRRQELREQCSPTNNPADRIRIWERLHQLPLPRSPSHRLMTVIAANTGLSLDEVQAEQRVRAAAESAAPMD